MLLSELKAEWSRQALSRQSLLRAKGSSEWRALADVPQLAWTVASSSGGGKALADVAVACLRILQGLCGLFPSADEEGRPKVPSPLVRRHLLADDCLPHIVQLLLAGYPRVVDEAMVLLAEMLRCAESSRIRRLYKTGFFFFALAYSGSNFGTIAAILKQTHLRQDFYCSDADVHNPTAPRNSVLRSFLPESLVCFLSNHDPHAFAAMLLGDCDTPEAIWHHKMRQHLISALSSHTIDLTLRLREDFLSCYEYMPLLQHVHYAELDGELWCQPYFLRNLVNTELFPEWRIAQPFEVLSAVIDLWHHQHVQQAARSAEAGGGMSQEQALGRLGISCGEAAEADPHDVRKAYRRLALQFHPDKNPEGRAEFEAVQRAYAVLTKKSRDKEGEEGREELRTLELLLKAQAILYQRCGAELAKYRYPCYAMLCGLIEKEIAAGRAATVCACMEVLALTAAADPGNAQELVLANGLSVVVDVLHRCLSSVDPSTARDNVELRTCAFACQAAAATIAEDIGSEQLCQMEGADDQRLSLMRDIVAAMSLQQSPPLATATLYACIAGSRCRVLLAQLLQHLQNAFLAVRRQIHHHVSLVRHLHLAHLATNHRCMNLWRITLEVKTHRMAARGIMLQDRHAQ